MKKSETEQLFVQELLETGVTSYCEMYERGYTYYCFFMKDGSQRFWIDISEENLKKLMGDS